MNLPGVDQQTLDEYLLRYDYLTKKLERIENRIEELTEGEDHKENVHKLECILGIRTITALSVIVETGDFRRIASAPQYAAHLCLVPGEDSIGGAQNRLSITKAGNRHFRMLLVEAAHCNGRGQIAFKSKALVARQNGNPSAVIEYADKANERLNRKYYRMTLKKLQ